MTTPQAEARPAMFAALAVPNFRRYVSGQSLSLIGTWVETVGVASVIFLTTGNATIQLASDPEYRGRVTALWSMALVGSTPIGSPVIGALSDTASPRYVLGLGAAACLGAAIIGGWPGGGLRQNTGCRPPSAQI